MCRYIPTLVGRFGHFFGKGYGTPVHPHACGEIYLSSSIIIFHSGTSPRLWGDSIVNLFFLSIKRYIPTLVGRLGHGDFSSCESEVHPHACGEICCRTVNTIAVFGTSPRLWGDSCASSHSRAAKRYIPTLVGRFTRPERGDRKNPVHPHACGEITRIAGTPFRLFGTSPRLWGDFGRGFFRPLYQRYIPTLVGRFFDVQFVRGFVWVHPHACGEIVMATLSCGILRGTSPRLWGDCLNTGRTPFLCRYIPTLVGRFVARSSI